MTKTLFAISIQFFVYRFSTPGRSEYIPVPEEQKDYIDSKIKEVESWFNSEDSKTPMLLDKCNPFQRRLLYQEVQKHFPDDIFMEPVNKIIEANKRPERVIQISKFDKDEQQRKVLIKFEAFIGVIYF